MHSRLTQPPNGPTSPHACAVAACFGCEFCGRRLVEFPYDDGRTQLTADAIVGVVPVSWMIDRPFVACEPCARAFANN